MLEKLKLSPEIMEALKKAPSIVFPNTRTELLEMALGGKDSEGMEISYEVPNKGLVKEAWTQKHSNGIAVNYFEPYMRRRDPDCMIIGDDLPTDKPTYIENYKESFTKTREQTLAWIEKQDLCITAFYLGKPFKSGKQYGGILIAPANAGFFVGGLADLQGLVPIDEITEDFEIRSVMFIAPPFRHTHFNGKQIVVHNRNNDIHEIFSYNLYPGPSAKKGVYGALLTIGEKEDWITLHAATVRATNKVNGQTVIMHEGASGSGKSEMLEQPHRTGDGKLLIGHNLVTNEIILADIPDVDVLEPLTDDMAMCHPRHSPTKGTLSAVDAEEAWFIRVDHITEEGMDPHIEHMTLENKEPLIFLNMQSNLGEPIKVWKHTEDSPGVACPNPRVIMPRRLVPNVAEEAMEVDIRNFGLRSPSTFDGQVSYGIVGFVHILPPALAWIWRLVSPRGHANPSVTAGAKLMASEGVGSYWPFATGKMVTQANLLLRQMQNSGSIRYTLTPNQHVGAWKVKFMSEWMGRSILSHADDNFFQLNNLVASPCPLLGYTPKNARVADFEIPEMFLRVETQPEVGELTYKKGAELLTNFFKEELSAFLVPELDSKGKEIIELFLKDAPLSAYEGLLEGILIE